MSFYLCDSVIVVYAQSADNDNAFQVFSAETGQFIRGFAHHGRGENELTDYFRSAIDWNNDLLYAVNNSNRYLAMDLKKAIAGDPQFVSHSYSFKGVNRMHKFAFLNDSTLFNVGTPHFFITDLYTGLDTLFQSNIYTPFPQYADNPLSLRMYYSYNQRFSMKPDLKKFVIATSCGMMLEIFDIDNYTVTSSALRKFYEPKMKNSYSLICQAFINLLYYPFLEF